MRNVRKGRNVALAIATSALSGCILVGKEEAPQGTEVENEVVGMLYLADGGPAESAKIRLYPVDWDPAQSGYQAPFDAVTDAAGHYRVKLEAGRYNIFGEKDGQFSMRDSVAVVANDRLLPSDTLDAPGSITGIVAVEPNHLPTTVTLDVLGSYIHANVDLTGRFRIADLPAGRYRLRAVSTVPEYTPLYVGFVVRPGREDTLADTLRLPYTGVPVVLGLKVAYDTATGAATISWHPSKYPLVFDYAVYRDRLGATALSKDPVAYTRDTSFVDTLYRNAGDTSVPSPRYEYRVRIRDKGDFMGPVFGSVAVEAPPPSAVQTHFSFAFPKGDSASINDTLLVRMSFRNPGRGLDSLEWLFGEPLRVVRSLRIAIRTGQDSLRVILPEHSGRLILAARMRDSSGTWGMDSAFLKAVEDRPKANAKDANGAVEMLSPVTLHGQASQAFGTIAKWEWDIGATGRFIVTSGPDTTFTPSDLAPELLFAQADVYLLRCVLRVTDDDGFSGLDTATLYLTGSIKTKVGEGDAWASMVEAGAQVYFFGKMENKPGEAYVLDTAGLSMAPIAPMPRRLQWPAAVARDGKIYVMGGYDEADQKASDRVFIFDRSSGEWSAGTPMARPGQGNAAAVLGGKFYLFQDSIQVYDPEKDAWSVFGPGLSGLDNGRAVVLGDRIYLTAANRDTLYSFSPSFGLGRVGRLPRAKCAMAAVDGRLIFLGGLYRSPDGYDYPGFYVSRVFEYHPAEGNWTSLPGLLHEEVVTNAPVIGSRVYLLGPQCGTRDLDTGLMKPCDSGEAYRISPTLR